MTMRLAIRLLRPRKRSTGGPLMLGHPSYSPDLAPCDFFLFTTLKKILQGRQFDDVADLQGAVLSPIASLGPFA